ncbi:hypothetical protein [Spirochaeta lutea]|uniref:Outer membrane protein beta-barrel domain-containing protein n=1 Tax=Spirochaeta lutea TaxID=1480694 RepID=A0A098QWR8_9SPIO|nr:hypothetical protein [Spirochaeta lutea]KGE70932.1 hypothetical protein DC28_13395 [Spirochaeta lutea]
MKRLLPLILILSLGAAGLSAQSGAINLTPLEEDFSTVFDSIASGVENSMLLSQTSGNIMGQATLGNRSFYISLLPPLGVTFGTGLLNLPDAESETWRFDVPVPTILEQALGENEDILSFAQKLMAYPNLSMVQFGFKLPADLELHARTMIMPAGLTKVILNAVDPTIGEAVSLQMIGGSVQVRRTLVQDRGFAPGLSIGAVYGFNHFSAGFDLGGLGLEPIDFSGQELVFGGGISTVANAHTFGLDLHVSKQLLFLTPFLKISPRYQVRTIDVTSDLTADVAGEESSFAPGIARNTAASSLVFTTGMEINLFVPVIHLGLVFDLQRPEIDLTDAGNLFAGDFANLDNLKLNRVGLNIGLRLQF